MKALQVLFVLVVGAAIFGLTLGGGTYILLTQSPLVVEGWQSRSWPGTTAIVKQSVADFRQAPSKPYRYGQGTHVVELRYEFKVEGRTYIGSRISLDTEGTILTPESAKKVLDRRPVGLALTAYFDPAQPSRSLLEPGVPTGRVLATLFGAALLGSGLALVLWPIQLFLRRKRDR